MTENENAEAKLYYLYMRSDGNVTYNEEKIFNTICIGLHINNVEKKTVIKDCEKLLKNQPHVFSVLLQENIDAQVERSLYGKKDQQTLSRIIWNLINLGYSNLDYSVEEKQIVNYLVAKWSVNPEVYRELADIAETMLALMKQKEWIQRTFTGNIRIKKEQKIDIALRQLQESVELTIKELAM